MKSRVFSIILSVVLFSQVCFAQLCAKLVNVSEGETHTLALAEDKSLWVCGAGGYAMGLGDNPGSVLSLQRVKGPNGAGYFNNVLAFDAGWYHSLVVDSNHFCWACGSQDESCGLLGNGPNEGSSNMPILVHGLNNDSNGLQNIVKVSAGRSGQHSLAIRNDGNLAAWGLNNYGQCGDGNSGDYKQSPVLVLDSNTQTTGRYLGQEANIVDIEAGEYHSLALASMADGGVVYEWGDGYSIPHKVPGQNGVGLLRNITDIANLTISLAVDSNHQVWQWSPGGNPTKIAGLEHIVKVAAGLYICAALDANNNVWQWWAGGSPAKVADGQQNTASGYLEDIIALDVGYYNQMVAIDNWGYGYSWDHNFGNALGVGDTDPHPLPTEMLCAELVPNDSDFNIDGIVNFFDFAVIAKSWKTSAGDADYNDICDLHNDGTIDYKDLDIFCENWLCIVGRDFNNGISGEGAYFEETMLGGSEEYLAPALASQEAAGVSLAVAGTATSLSEESQTVDVNELVNWLDEIWLSGDLKDSMSEEEYLEFRKTIEELGQY